MQDVREIFVPTLLWAGLAHWWDFRPRQRLVPGREPWSQEAFNIYETSQIKSEKISDVSIGPCAWQGQNGHIACRDINSSTKSCWGRIDYPLGLLSLSDSLSLPSSHKHWTDLIVGGGFAGQPPAGLSCFAGQHIEEGTSLMMPRHRLKKSLTQDTKLVKTKIYRETGNK